MSGFLPQIVDAGEPERLVVGEASEDFLEVYGIKPHLGRTILIDDTQQGGPLVALLGYAYWQSRFGGSPDVIGRVIRIADTPATIVGVLPAGFYRETAVWKPIQLPTMKARGSGTPVIGRLRAGVSFVQAQGELAGILTTVPPAPGDSATVGAELSSMYDEATHGQGTTIRLLAFAVALIVLIACVNVAGLLLARGAIREPELAIRASIGARRVWCGSS